MRLAFDISVLTSIQRKEKTGLSRVTGELLKALTRRWDVQLTALPLCGFSLLDDSLAAAAYCRAEGLDCEVTGNFAGRIAFPDVYFHAFADANHSHVARVLRSLLFRVEGVDRFRRYFDSSKYDVFHSPFLPLPSESLTGATQRVITINDLYPLRLHGAANEGVVEWLKHILGSINKGRDTVICISEFTKNDFCDYTEMSPDRVFVTPLAAAEHFRPSSATDITDVRRRYLIFGDYFLSLCTLEPRKNLAHLVRCFYRLCEENLKDTMLVLVGAEGWLTEDLSQALDSKWRSRVIVTGYVPEEDLSALYGGATAFVCPSLFEGFGMPVLEAMQCGTPVISSNATSLPEVVGDAAILVDPKDSDALCHAMLEVVSRDSLRRELSVKGISRARAFSWGACAESTVGAYRAAMAG
jgi:glycosyltransferase involved in cell wall biosynthesis